METKLMMRQGISTLTSEESEPLTDTLRAYDISRYRPRSIVRASDYESKLSAQQHMRFLQVHLVRTGSSRK